MIIMHKLIKNPQKNDPRIKALLTRLHQFYDTTLAYPCNELINNHDNLFQLVDPIIESIVSIKGVVRVLELGAGRTTYPIYLKERGFPIIYSAQDITARNKDYLLSNCDQVFIGDIEEINGNFDLIISAFVFEHISAPLEFLEDIYRLLDINGWHILFCPRYDVLGYIPPSIRHLPITLKFNTYCEILLNRISARINKTPSFLVNPDPAVFYCDWYRDADAVHLVSYYDVKKWHEDRGFQIKQLKPPSSSFRAFLQYQYLTLNAAFKKASESSRG